MHMHKKSEFVSFCINPKCDLSPLSDCNKLHLLFEEDPSGVCPI